MMRSFVAVFVAVLSCATLVHADIYEWEYIDPANPSLGRQQSATLCEDGAGVSAVPGADLSYLNLTSAFLPAANLPGASLQWSNFLAADLGNANLAGADLSGAAFVSAVLTGADFTGADISCAFFTTGSGRLTREQFLSTASYQRGDLEWVALPPMDLTGCDFAGKNLTGAGLGGCSLAGADFAGAVIHQTDFQHATGLTAEQLYSTASYVNDDLRGVGFAQVDVSGMSFVGKDIRDSSFAWATVTNTDFSWADMRGCSTTTGVPGALSRNTIWNTGQVNGLHLLVGETMRLRDDDGFRNQRPGSNLGTVRSAYGIHVADGMSLVGDATLQLVIEDANWASTIAFGSAWPPLPANPPVNVTLAGTLNLQIAPDAETSLADLVGVTFDLFDWDGASVTGQFAHITTQPWLTWDTSKLYTTGEVTLTGIPEPATMAMLAIGAAGLLRRRR